MKIYKEEEEVTFIIGSETFTGTILSTHVSIKNSANHVVFDKLGINYDNRTLFCSKYYGYKAKDGGAWPPCKSGDYEALSRLIHALQELCDKHNGWTLSPELSPESTKELNIGDKVRIIGNETDDPHKFKIGEVVTIEGFIGRRYNCTNQKESWMVNKDCVAQVDDTVTQEIKVGDWVKCISNDYVYAKNYIIGKKYQIIEFIDLKNSTKKHRVKAEYDNDYWQEVPGKCFIPCESECVEPIQDNSEWKIGDKLQYIREGTYDWRMSLNDCTVGMIYTIVKMSRTLGYPVIIDDVEDTVSLSPEELKCFKKIINNQTTTINYVKDNNNNNSFELPSSSPAISARQIARGGIVSSSDLEIWI